MPQLRLTTHSDHLNRVVNAFEAEVGLPLSHNPDTSWLVAVVGEYNKARDTQIGFDHEDYGYWFKYSTPEEANLLAEIRRKYDLGGDK